jgi:hypothetical protein
MEKYCVFLFNAKTNELSEVLLKDVTKEEAIAERDRLKKEGLPAHYEAEETMRKKFNMSSKE